MNFNLIVRIYNIEIHLPIYYHKCYNYATIKKEIIMINSRDLNDLHPKVKEMCQQFVKDCAMAGIKVIITSTYRDNESQNELYAQGRSKPGNIVTKAKGGQSFHNYRIAFDFCPVINGIPQWENLELFKRCGEIGKKIGLEYAGDWVKFKEYCHCQYTGGLTLADLQAGKEIKS